MTFDLSQAGIASFHLYKEDHPGIFQCKDFLVGECCEDCHKKGHVIAVYPWSALSRTAPDISLGLRAEICCRRFDAVRDLPRSWWIQRYGEKSGWNAADIKRLSETPDLLYHKVSGEIASKYFRGGSQSSISPGPSRVSTPRRPASRKGCPSCGKGWDGIVCDNCGHSG